jgi:hypothetical protein
MYKIISPSSEPSIIGVNNGVYQVELIDKKSFINKEEKQYYENFFSGKFTSFIFDNFQNINLTKITELKYFPLKKANETDFVRFSPNEMGLNFIVSQKVIDIFKQFSIYDYIKIPSKIDGFQTNYYTIGFPIITDNFINFPKSKFYHLINKTEFNNLSHEEYKKISGALVKTLSLELTDNNFKSDIINLQGQGIFFSNSLISKLKDENVTSFEIGNTTLIT